MEDKNMMTRIQISTPTCIAALLLASPALGNWQNYNSNYGKGASFSKGTMIRNGSGSSPRVSAGSTAVSTSKRRVVTPQRTFTTFKHQNGTIKLRRLGKPSSKRSVSINNKYIVTGKNTIRIQGEGLKHSEARRLVDELGGTKVGSKIKDGKVVHVTFIAKEGSLLSRLGGMVYRVNKKSRTRRIKGSANQGSGKASGNPLYTSPTSNPEHSARANQPGYKDGNTTSRAGYLRNYGTSGRWGHGRYRTR
jgi:hypothetical protein